MTDQEYEERHQQMLDEAFATDREVAMIVAVILLVGMGLGVAFLDWFIK